MLIGCAAAPTLGDRLPGAESRRFILREQTDPPFDPRAYPSPLAGFRRYKDVLKDRRGLKERTLFTVAGMPSDARIRMAVLDAYDGAVWCVSGSGTSATGDTGGRQTASYEPTANDPVTGCRAVALSGKWPVTLTRGRAKRLTRNASIPTQNSARKV